MENESIIGYIKVTAANLRTLHRHLVGGQWFEDHEKLGEYYEKIDEFEDSVAENLIALGMKDMTIAEASQKYHVLENREYKAAEAFALTKKYFDTLLDMFKRFKESADELPDGVKSKFEEYEHWLFLESKYKLARMLRENDIGDLFN